MNPIPEHLTRYSRQIKLPYIGVEGQECLLKSRVTVLGIGALGTNLASGLVRAGVGYVRLIDRDFIEEHNLQRQTLFDEADIAANFPKAVAAAEKLRRINHQVMVDPLVMDATFDNIESLVGDVDLVLDGSDNFEIRMLLNDACVKLNRPWIYGAVTATEGMTMNILPGEGPCFRCMMGTVPAPGSVPTCDITGVLGTGPQIIAAFQVTEALKLLAGHPEQLCRTLRYIDIWNGHIEPIRLERSPSCPTCGARHFEFLEGAQQSRGLTLCGRTAVQITPAVRTTMDFSALAERLSALGEVDYNAYMLRLTLAPYEMTLFPDGRAIIKGTNDPGVARSFYSRYIG